MKAHVDKNSCIGCGLCANICPDVFEIKGDIAIVKSDPVSPENIESCRQAVEDCPVSAIKME
jgi:ferredoxin